MSDKEPNCLPRLLEHAARQEAVHLRARAPPGPRSELPQGNVHRVATGQHARQRIQRARDAEGVEGRDRRGGGALNFVDSTPSHPFLKLSNRVGHVRETIPWEVNTVFKSSSFIGGLYVGRG